VLESTKAKVLTVEKLGIQNIVTLLNKEDGQTFQSDFVLNFEESLFI
jgi:hypothetical protein